MSAKTEIPVELMRAPQLAAHARALSEQSARYVRDELARESGLIDLLEWMQAERHWRNTRADLAGIDLYADVPDPQARSAALAYVYALFSHENGMIRRMAAETAGCLLAKCDTKMRAGMWKSFLREMLFPEQNISGRGRRRIGYAIRTVLPALLARSDDSAQREVLRIYVAWFKSARWNHIACLSLITGIADVPFCQWNAQQRTAIFAYVRKQLASGDGELQMAGLWLLDLWMSQGWQAAEEEKDYLRDLSEDLGDEVCVRYLKGRLRRDLGLPTFVQIREVYDAEMLITESLRPTQSWLATLVRLRILRELALGGSLDRNRYSAHLHHLLRMSSYAVVRLQAGRDLTDVSSHLDGDARMQIARDLLRAIELREEGAAHFIPRVFGVLFRQCGADDQRTLLGRLRSLMYSADPEDACTAAETVSVILEQWPQQGGAEGARRRSESGDEIKGKLIGLLTTGLAARAASVVRETLALVMRLLSRADRMRGEDPQAVELWERALIVAERGPADPEDFYFAETFCHMGSIAQAMTPSDRSPRKIAFFSGVFDPFTRGHRDRVKAAADQGFCIYLNVHEFDWTRRTQPHRTRRQMAEMSVADLAHVRLFPEEIPINLALPSDLARLRSYFPGEEVRVMTDEETDSADLRGLLESGRELSEIVTEPVRELIYERKMYEGAIPYKRTAREKPIRVLRSAEKEAGSGQHVPCDAVGRAERIGILDACAGDTPLATALVERIPADRICEVLPEAVCAALGTGAGREMVVVIREVVGAEEDDRLTALMEALAICQAERCSFAVCAAEMEGAAGLGFRRVEDSPDHAVVDLRHPMVLLFDTAACIRAPYVDDPRVTEVLHTCRKRLQSAAAALFPGELVISLDADILNHRLIDRIMADDDGTKLCVPFGKILKGVRIPDVVTQDLNSEKCYAEDLGSFEIREFPGEASLRAQIRTIRSFGRDVILVDDLYHRGYRLEKIGKLLIEEDVPVTNTVVGILSGEGEALARREGRTIEAVYHLPGMRCWMIASDLYPFIGGDSLDASPGADRRVGASINMILPYHVPSYLRGARAEDFYALSKVCIENARAIHQALEKIYQELHHRKLSLARIGEVMVEPRYPADAVAGADAAQERASSILARELTRLERLRHFADFQGG